MPAAAIPRLVAWIAEPFFMPFTQKSCNKSAARSSSFSGESLRVCAGDLYSFDVKKLFYFRTLVVPPLDILAEPVTTQFFAIISCILAGSSAAAAALDPDSIWLLLGSGAFRS